MIKHIESTLIKSVHFEKKQAYLQSFTAQIANEISILFRGYHFPAFLKFQ